MPSKRVNMAASLKARRPRKAARVSAEEGGPLIAHMMFKPRYTSIYTFIPCIYIFLKKLNGVLMCTIMYAAE